MSQGRALVWVSDPTDRRVVAVRGLFLRGLEEQSRNVINYYDFLLVAKKLNFRFEESAHLMELRKFFFSHKNQLLNKKLTALLCIEEQSLADVAPERTPDKIIIRFRVSQQIESIQQLTNQDEQGQSEGEGEQTEVVPYGQPHRLHSEEKGEESQEYRQKLTIILSIKVAEMVRKLKLLVEGVPAFQDQQPASNIFTSFSSLTQNQIPYQIFRKGVVTLLRQMEADFFRERLTMSEDDIRALYSILDIEGEGKLRKDHLELLNNEPEMAKRITKFYEARINKRMVKNTLFKLGKNSNSIQIYQVKNASVLEFRTIQDGLLEPQKKQRLRPKQPHFGPIKGGAKQSPGRLDNRQNKSSLGTYKREGESNLEREREKIERIIRSSKEEKKRVGNDTIANKLRKLFIHKVILPREKLLQQEKQKYLGGINKTQSSHIVAKLT